MKKYFALFLSIAMVFVVLSACIPSDKPDNTTTNSQNYFTTTAPSATSGVTQVIYGTGMSGLGFTNTIEYTGEEIERLCNISTYSQHPVAMVLFTNGYLQPYSVNGSEYAYMHTLSGGQYTFRFHPVTGKSGEKVTFIACALDRPEFKKDADGNYYEFLDWHKMGATSGVTIEMKADAPTSAPETASDLTHVEDVATIFKAMSGVGDNPPSTLDWPIFRVYDKIVELDRWENLKEDDVGRQNKISAQKGTEHEVFISCYGKAGTYRVCLFINDELQYAFDGKAYVDMEISGDMQTTCSVKIDTNKLNEDNYIYVMYYPIDLDIEDMVNAVHKTYSNIFTVQD